MIRFRYWEASFTSQEKNVFLDTENLSFLNTQSVKFIY